MEAFNEYVRFNLERIRNDFPDLTQYEALDLSIKYSQYVYIESIGDTIDEMLVQLESIASRTNDDV